MDNSKIALVTGATAGIGEAIANVLAKLGYNIIITGRRKDKLVSLQRKIEKSYFVKVLPLNFDVRNKEEVKKQINALSQHWSAIDVLVNNAGLALGLEPINNGNEDDWDTMIDTNIKGLLYMARAVSPIMVKRKKGHIVNISSVAAKEVYKNGNVYAATKHAVDALNKGMRLDLAEHKIKVTSIAPGFVDTEFSVVRFNGDAEKAKKVYEGFVPLYARDIADAVEFAVTRPAHVNINDLHIMPTAQPNVTTIYRDTE
ncbi:SDR family NAD(P)-dependent oxidoreductase [Bacteroidales bacterium]|nr:SDR family NAD(P)-dependent oxidoreductase [Bacteroidales bacterium]